MSIRYVPTRLSILIFNVPLSTVPHELSIDRTTLPASQRVRTFRHCAQACMAYRAEDCHNWRSVEHPSFPDSSVFRSWMTVSIEYLPPGFLLPIWELVEVELNLDRFARTL